MEISHENVLLFAEFDLLNLHLKIYETFLNHFTMIPLKSSFPILEVPI